jgi:hypothetical protein
MGKSFINNYIEEINNKLSENLIEVFGEEFFNENLKDFLEIEINKFFATELMTERGITVVCGSSDPKSSIWNEQNQELFYLKEMIDKTHKDVKLMILKKENLSLIKELVKLTIKNPNFSLISCEEAIKGKNFDLGLNSDIVFLDEKLKKLEEKYEIKNTIIFDSAKDIMIKKQKYSSTKDKIENMRKYRR